MTRRHRLHGDEVPEVIEGLRLRLQHHLETRADLYRAAIAFRAYFSLTEHVTSRPAYPDPITWSIIESRINGTNVVGGERPQPPDPEGEVAP